MENEISSESSFRLLFDNVPVGLFRASLEGKILVVNRRLCKILGYNSAEETSDLKLISGLLPAAVSISELLVKFDYIDCFCGETKWTKPDGTVINICCSLSPERDSQGAIKYLDGTVEDITEKKRLADLAALTQDLYINLNSMNDLYDALNYLFERFCSIEGIDSGGLYFVNQETGAVDLVHHKGLSQEFVKEITHYEADSINAKILKAGFPVFDSYPKAVNNSASPEKLKEGIKTIAILPILHEGKVIAALNLASHKKNGIPAYLRSTLEAMTVQFGGTINRLKAEDEIRKVVAKLDESNSTKDKLFSIIAHDLRGPFTGFIGMSETLSEQIAILSKDQIATLSRVMNETSKRVFNLLTNLLEWSKIQTGRMNFWNEELNLYFETEILLSSFYQNAAAKKIEIRNDIEHIGTVFTDKNMLAALLRNLVSNAVKFTPEGGTIIISSEDCADHVEVSVTDTGVGLEKEELAGLFNFKSIISRRGTNGEKGSGIGLRLCKELIESNGGILSVFSRPGEGSRFTFTLPYYQKN